MKVVCIKPFADDLIKGLIYDLEERPGNVGDKYIIDNRWTINEYYIRDYFVLLAEFREQRINKILE
jgi:hypothetical protein